MPYPHVIRLRDPWRRQEHEGFIRHARRFNCPTGLDESERVWIVVESTAGSAVVRLNGQEVGRLAGGAAGEFDVTALLCPHNEIQIDLQPPQPPQETLPGKVRLEIRPCG